MVLREFPSRSGHTGGVVTPVGSHLLILGSNSKGEPLFLCSIDPNVDTGLEFTPEDLGPAIVPTAGMEAWE